MCGYLAWSIIVVIVRIYFLCEKSCLTKSWLSLLIESVLRHCYQWLFTDYISIICHFIIWHFYQWHFYRLAFLPPAFLPFGIFTTGITTVWHFYHWHFYHLAYLPMTFLPSGIFTNGIFTIWHIYQWHFYHLAFSPMAFLPMAFLLIAFLRTSAVGLLIVEQITNYDLLRLRPLHRDWYFFLGPLYVSKAQCSRGPIFRRFYIPKVLCSEGSIFRRFYVPKVLYSEGSMFLKSIANSVFSIYQLNIYI